MEKKKQKQKRNASYTVSKQSLDQNNILDNSSKSVLIRKVFRCLDCYFIPLLQLKENDTKVELNCLQNHKSEISLKDYMIKGFNNSLDRVKCMVCGLMKESKMIYKLCEECNSIMCKECLKEHNSKNRKHHVITVRKMDTVCALHQSNFTYFCKKCNKNICDECLNDHKRIEHDIVCLNEINLNKKQIEEIKQKIEEEKENLNEIINVFNDNMIKLQNKFNDIIKDKKQVIKYKKNILESYELKNINYQVINNLKNLKFTYDQFKVEPDSDELDNIIKLFDYLIERDTKNNKNKKENIFTIVKEKEFALIKEDKKSEIDLNIFAIVKEKDLFIDKEEKKPEIDLNIFSIIKENEIFISKQDDQNKNGENIISKNYHFMIKRKEIKIDNKIEKNFSVTIGKKNKKKYINIIDYGISFIIKKKEKEKKNKENKNIIDPNLSFTIKKKTENAKDKNKKERERINNNIIVQNFNFTIKKRLKRVKPKEYIIREKEPRSRKESNNYEDMILKKDSRHSDKNSKKNTTANTVHNSDERERLQDTAVESGSDKIKKTNSKKTEIKKKNPVNPPLEKKEERKEIKDYNYYKNKEELKMTNNKNNFLEFMNKINEIPIIDNLEFSSSSIKLVKNIESMRLKNNNTKNKIEPQKKINYMAPGIEKKIEEDEPDSNNNEQSMSIQLPKSPSFKEINLDKRIESFVCDQSEQLGFIFDEMNEDRKKKNKEDSIKTEKEKDKDKEKRKEIDKIYKK